MKKSNAKKIIIGTIISMGLAIPLTLTHNHAVLKQPQTVEAATKKITLKRNAYLYNYKGNRVGNKKLYKNHTYTYYSIKKIKGKKYYKISRNRYIKAANVSTKKHTNKANTPSNLIPEKSPKLSLNTSGLGTPKFQVSIDKTNADIYSASHATADGSWIGAIMLNGTYNVYAKDNGMYEIGKDQWIHSDIAEVVSTSSNKTNQAKLDNSKKVTASNQSSLKNSANTPKQQKANPSEADLQDAANKFLAMVNKDREALGRKPLTLNAHLSEEAKQRSIHDAEHLVKYGTEDNHRDENGNHIMPDDSLTEIETMLNRNLDISAFAYNQFMNNDAEANWGHKNALLNPDFSEIGIGITIGNGPTISTYGSLVCEFN